MSYIEVTKLTSGEVSDAPDIEEEGGSVEVEHTDDSENNA